MTERERTRLDEKMDLIVDDEIHNATPPHDVAGVLARKFPKLVDRRAAHALVEQAFDNDAHIELDPDVTAPFVRESYSQSFTPPRGEFGDDLDKHVDDFDPDDGAADDDECPYCDYGCDRCSPLVEVQKRSDGAYTAGPPPDGRSVDEHLGELAKS